MMTALEVLKISAAAECDMRTTRRYFRGDPIRSISKVRIERAMRELGFTGPAKTRDRSRAKAAS